MLFNKYNIEENNTFRTGIQLNVLTITILFPEQQQQYLQQQNPYKVKLSSKEWKTHTSVPADLIHCMQVGLQLVEAGEAGLSSTSKFTRVCQILR